MKHLGDKQLTKLCHRAPTGACELKPYDLCIGLIEADRAPTGACELKPALSRLPTSRPIAPPRGRVN